MSSHTKSISGPRTNLHMYVRARATPQESQLTRAETAKVARRITCGIGEDKAGPDSAMAARSSAARGSCGARRGIGGQCSVSRAAESSGRRGGAVSLGRSSQHSIQSSISCCTHRYGNQPICTHLPLPAQEASVMQCHHVQLYYRRLPNLVDVDKEVFTRRVTLPPLKRIGRRPLRRAHHADRRIPGGKKGNMGDEGSCGM